MTTSHRRYRTTGKTTRHAKARAARRYRRRAHAIDEDMFRVADDHMPSISPGDWVWRYLRDAAAERDRWLNKAAS